MTTVLVTLIQNAALLPAMMVVFDLVTSRKPVYGQWRRQAMACDREFILARGFDDSVAKPIDLEMLTKTITEVLHGKD
jgi:CheY-like chemotaxis protein